MHEIGTWTWRAVVAASIVAGMLAVPALACASSEPATLYQANLSGGATLQAVSSDTMGDQWTTTATFPLNGSTVPLAASHETAADTDVWIPTGSGPSIVAEYDGNSPDFSASAAAPDTSLTAVGVNQGNAISCSTTLDYSLTPTIGVTTPASGSSSILVDWEGDLVPDGGDTNENGNANDFPSPCAVPPTFELQTPLTGPIDVGGTTAFDLPWSEGYDSLRFSFTGVNGTSVTENLTGTSQSQVAAANGGDDGNVSCTNDAEYGTMCSESYTSISENLILTKICTGTITTAGKRSDGSTLVDGTCGSATSASAVRISSARVSPARHTARFVFSATGAKSFQCALIPVPRGRHAATRPTFRRCSSPKAYAHLVDGNYTFEVRGVSAGGAPGHVTTKSFKI